MLGEVLLELGEQDRQTDHIIAIKAVSERTYYFYFNCERLLESHSRAETHPKKINRRIKDEDDR